MSHRYLCIDINGTTVRHAVIDSSLKIEERAEIKLEPAEHVFNSIALLCRDLSGGTRGTALAVGGIGRSGSELNRFSGLSPEHESIFSDELKNLTGKPLTMIDRARAIVLAEQKWGALAGCRNAVYFHLGRETGAALIQNDEIVRAAYYSDFEKQRNAAWDHENSVWYRKRGIAALIDDAADDRGIDSESIDSQMIIDWADEQDDRVLQALDIFARDFIRLIFNFQLVYQLDCVIVGGTMTRYPVFRDDVFRYLDFYHKVYEPQIPKICLKEAVFTSESAMIGALAHHLDIFPEQVENDRRV